MSVANGVLSSCQKSQSWPWIILKKTSGRCSYLIRVPPAVTEVESTHESNATVDETKLFVVCPVKDSLFVGTIDCFQGIHRKLRKGGGSHALTLNLTPEV